MAEEPEAAPGSNRKLTIGSIVISGLGVLFGSCLIIAGSELTWRSDRVLGFYNQSGWSFRNLVHGDGKITMALGIVIAIGLILGALLKSRHAYAVGLGADLLVMALCVYELIFLSTRNGIIGAGNGLYMVLGGTVAGGLCCLGGYLMMKETLDGPAEPVLKETPAEAP
jgi:hypothetical protein